MNSIRSKITGVLAPEVAIALAGPNKDAELFIDCAPASPGIDTTGMCIAESSFVMGLFIHGAKKLYSYQCYIAYDTTFLKFVSAAKGNDTCRNFLESKGGLNSLATGATRFRLARKFL